MSSFFIDYFMSSEGFKDSQRGTGNMSSFFTDYFMSSEGFTAETF